MVCCKNKKYYSFLQPGIPTKSEFDKWITMWHSRVAKSDSVQRVASEFIYAPKITRNNTWNATCS